MDRGTLGALVAVAVVVVIGFIARSAGGRGEQVTMPAEDALSEGAAPPSADRDEDRDPEDDEDDWEQVEVIAVTSDGYALVPDRHAVRLVPPHEEGEAWKAGSTTRNRRGEQALAMSWQAGDFTGARVVQGAADEGPWRLEALGRDGEYCAFVFETREGADAAFNLLTSRGVVRVGQDDDGRDVPPAAEQFEEARRVFLETEAALDHDDDNDLR
jgi:hypothetical protein